MDDPSTLGLERGAPISEHEHVELDFLRYENAHLQSRVRELEKQVRNVTVERDTIRHERNLAIQDLRWTLDRLARSPIGPAMRRLDGFRRLQKKWAE